MKVTSVTASYSHQFNDPSESFANHRFSVSATAEILEGESPSGILDKLQAHCEEEVNRERTIVEMRDRFSRDLAWARAAPKECSAIIDQESQRNELSDAEQKRLTDAHHDRPILESYLRIMEDHKAMMTRDDLWREDPYPSRPKNLRRSYYCPF